MAAPRPRTIRLAGVVATGDLIGRVRLLLVDPLPSGAPNPRMTEFYEALRGAPGWDHPCTLHERDAENVRGEVRIAVPARHRDHWQRVADSLRGQEAQAEVKTRAYSFVDSQGVRRRGIAYDLQMLEPLLPAPTR